MVTPQKVPRKRKKKFVKKVGGETVGKWNLHCPLWQGKNAWKIRL